MSRSRRMVEMMRGFTDPDMFGLPDDMQQMPLSDFQARWGDAMEVVVITPRGEDIVPPTAVKVGDTVQLPEIGNVKIIGEPGPDKLDQVIQRLRSKPRPVNWDRFPTSD